MNQDTIISSDSKALPDRLIPDSLTRKYKCYGVLCHGEYIHYSSEGFAIGRLLAKAYFNNGNVDSIRYFNYYFNGILSTYLINFIDQSVTYLITADSSHIPVVSKIPEHLPYIDPYWPLLETGSIFSGYPPHKVYHFRNDGKKFVSKGEYDKETQVSKWEFYDEKENVIKKLSYKEGILMPAE